MSGALTAPVAAQEIRWLEGPPLCAGCAIERELVTVVNDRSFEGGAIGEAAGLHANADGTYFVLTGGFLWDELYVTDTTGAVVRRIGAKGDGPGEYRIPVHVLELPSTYAVIDGRLSRVTHLDKGTLTLEGTAPLPGEVGGAPPIALPDGSVLFMGTVRTRENIGHPIHRMAPDGELVRSYGAASDHPPTEEQPRRLEASGDTAFWAAYPSYRLELWHLDGRLLETYRRSPGWLPPIPPDGSAGLEPGDPYPTLWSLHEDEGGRLWIHYVIRESVGGGRFSADPEDYRSVIEVLDVRGDRLVVTDILDGVREISLPGHGFFQTRRRFDADGFVEYEVWRSRIVRREGG